MARFGADRPHNGTLSFSKDPAKSTTNVEFVATTSALVATGRGSKHSKVKIAEVDLSTSTITIYPINTLLSSARFLEPKYPQVRRIVLPLSSVSAVPTSDDEFDELLENLPRGFTRDFQFGLGVPKEYKVILDTIEKSTGCAEVIFGVFGVSEVIEKSFRFDLQEFEDIRAEIDRITNRANAAAGGIKAATVSNVLATALGIDAVPLPRGRHPIRQLIADQITGDASLNEDEQDVLLTAVITEARTVASRRPDRLTRLRDDIELVSLEVLVESFESALAVGHSESYWQAFFGRNPFALHLAFGHPVIQVQGQASVGGVRLSGSGEKIADFVVKNALTNNVGLFEIKTPKTPLVRKVPYRDGVYSPSQDVVGAITQVLDQRYQLVRSFSLLKESSRLHDLESYAVKCCIVVGSHLQDHDQAKSFELFRANSRDVEIVTYDELLIKLRQLLDLVQRPVSPGNSGSAG